MKRLRVLLLPVVVLLAWTGVALATVPSFYWTGIGNGWYQQTSPSSGADLVFLRSLNKDIVFTADFTANSLKFEGGDDGYNFSAGSPVNLTLLNGLSLALKTGGGNVTFSSNYTLTLGGAQTWDTGTDSLWIGGTVAGTGPLTIHFNADGTGNVGSVIFTNTSTGNTYTGGTVLDQAAGTQSNGIGTVAFWNTSPFGTGAVSITNGVFFSSHGTNTITNNFSISANSGAQWGLRNWDAATTYSGAITLTGNTLISSKVAWTNHLAAPNNQGTFALAGTFSRYPTIFTGAIGESGGARTVTIAGPGITIFNPGSANTYTGGTTVSNGTLVLANANAFPATGAITQTAAAAYIGIVDTSPGNFATFLGKLASATPGAVGIDTLPGAATTTNLTDNIDLSSFTTTGGGIRLGTATKAIISGTITPQLTATSNWYHFGGGGGTLVVASNLTDDSNPAHSSQSIRAVTLDNPQFEPLKVFLTGTNTYTGGANVHNGFLIFDGPSALPASGPLIAYNGSNIQPSGYIGYTDAVTGLTPSAFLARFDKTNTHGIIGFDTTAANLATPVTINGVDLTGFNDGVFLGTATAATITGTLVPSTVTNATYAANTLRFTAGNGGTLTVGSTLADNGSPLGVVLGSPYPTPALSDGTVILTGPNTYTGGTTLNSQGGLTVQFNTANAFGTGTISINPTGTTNTLLGLAAGNASLVLPNAIAFGSPDYINTAPVEVDLTGSYNYTLAGNLTSGAANRSMGQIPASLTLNNSTPINVTLTGNNSGFAGDINLVNGTLTLTNDTSGNNYAAGTGTMNFIGSSATLEFSGTAATNHLYGITGTGGRIFVNDGTNLVFHTDDGNQDQYFGGTISGRNVDNMPVSTTASVTVTSASTNNNLLYLSGNNQYTGGTTISGHAALGLGSSSSAGTGTITINASQGGLALNSGVTLTNPIVFTQGGLAGVGTFAPTSVNGVAGGALTFGTGQVVFPGIPGGNHDLPAQLTFGTLSSQQNLIFANGGSYEWGLIDATANLTASEGFSSLLIYGNLNLSSLSAGQFTLYATTYDTNGTKNPTTLTMGNTYSFAIATTTNGGIVSGFNAADFTIDATNFQGGQIPASNFYVTSDSTHLYLNFVAVPEPSTYALFALGLAMLGGAAWRRRRMSR